MIVLGIDPGLALTGYAALDVHGEGVGGTPKLVEAGVFRFSRTRTVSQRLLELQKDLQSLFDRTQPTGICVESLFAHYGHPRTAIVMAHARGVILLTAAKAGLPLLELPPAEVKKSITGNGRAAKPQIQHAISVLLGLPRLPEPADVADAIAIALCGSRRWEGRLSEDGHVVPALPPRRAQRRLRSSSIP